MLVLGTVSHTFSWNPEVMVTRDYSQADHSSNRVDALRSPVFTASTARKRSNHYPESSVNVRRYRNINLFPYSPDSNYGPV